MLRAVQSVRLQWQRGRFFRVAVEQSGSSLGS